MTIELLNLTLWTQLDALSPVSTSEQVHEKHSDSSRAGLLEIADRTGRPVCHMACQQAAPMHLKTHCDAYDAMKQPRTRVAAPGKVFVFKKGSQREPNDSLRKVLAERKDSF